jgi:hypothetical protein
MIPVNRLSPESAYPLMALTTCYVISGALGIPYCHHGCTGSMLLKKSACDLIQMGRKRGNSMAPVINTPHAGISVAVAFTVLIASDQWGRATNIKALTVDLAGD